MPELTLSTWANLAEIVGAGSIVTGLIVGWFQIRYSRAQQRDAVAINLMQTFYSQDLAQAMALLQPIPDGTTLEEMRALGTDYVNAAMTVTTSFETMGLLVFRRMATLDLVLDLAGGIITTMGRKLSVWQQEMRVDQNQPSWGEWFEWLSDQAEKEKHIEDPAHIKYRDWAK